MANDQFLSKYKTEWCNSISEISPNDWDSIFENQVLKSYSFFKSTEEAKPPGASFLYLKISRKKEILAILPCFTYKLSLDVLAPDFVKRITKKIKTVFPDFLQVRILGVGSLTSTCSQHIGISKNISEGEYCILKKIISEQIRLRSKALKHKIVFIKEVPYGELDFVKMFFTNDFYFYNSLPCCHVPVYKELTPYPSALRRKERQRIKTLRGKFDNIFSWEVISDFKKIENEFEKLYLETLDRSKNKFEILNKDYFCILKKQFGEKTFFLAAKNDKEEYQSIGIVLEDESALIPLYLGINHINDISICKLLHSNSLLRVIEEAIIREKSDVILGQTSYYPKVLSGAFVEQLYLGFYSYHKVVRFLIKHIFGKLFTSTPVMDNVYKKEFSDKIRMWYFKKGIHVCN